MLMESGWTSRTQDWSVRGPAPSPGANWGASRPRLQIPEPDALTPRGGGAELAPWAPAPFHARTPVFEVLGWDYFTEQHTFSPARTGPPNCPLQGPARGRRGRRSGDAALGS